MRSYLFALLAMLAGAPLSAAESDPLRVLFLGDNGHHRPAERFAQLQPVLAERGIELTYTDDVGDLKPQTLDRYDGLIVYANTTEISPEQEQALLDFVAGGKGFIPLHCASYCFLNSEKYVALVGAQFQRHETGVFRTETADAEHPILDGYRGFESWDETYVHHRHNDDRTILEYRPGESGREPWTWVRTHGDGRVFYTAWGHDGRTWSHPGFHNLVERGIRWAVGDDPREAGEFVSQPEMTSLPEGPPPFEYVEAEVPFYPAGERWGTIGEPIRKMQKPLPPHESQKRLVTPVGFEAKLFAAEPNIGKPICMNWDHRGRLWIAETVDYPNEKQPEGQGRDRIRICEDTDGDGRADEFTVFAEDLSIPTSLAFAWGGVVVHQAPDTLFLQDIDGDDRADVRRTLLSGWDTSDTHAGPSNLQYGPDNWFYGMVGYAGFRGEVAGEEHSFRTGFYRFKLERENGADQPIVTKLEFLRNTDNNSWGVGFSEEGLLFGSTANGNPSVHLPIPNRYYERVRGWSSSVLGSIALDSQFDPITDKVRQVDHHGRFTAAAGHALYTARTYPQEYWNRTAFVAGPTGHLLATFTLQPDGATYRSRNSWNLLASDDEWTAPIMAEVGPDGQVWVIDWYNYIVQHNPTPTGYKTGKGNAYETDLRDKKHGRIYRVVYKEAEQADPVSLADATPQELVGALRHPNFLWRRHAQRLLIERGERDVVPQLLELVSDENVDAIGLNVGAIHALWTLHGLGAIDNAAPEAVVLALTHDSAGVRRNAVQVLPNNPKSVELLIENDVLDDEDAQVRLAALLALSDQRATAEAAEAAFAAIQDRATLRDRWLSDAAASAAANNAEGVLRLATQQEREGPAAADFLGILQRVAEHYARGGPTDSVAEIFARLPKASPPAAAAIVAGVSRGWPRDQAPDTEGALDEALVSLLTTLPAASRGQLASLADRWGSEALESHAAEIAAAFLEQVQDRQLDDDARVAAARRLIEFRNNDAEIAGKLVSLITPQTGPELAFGLLEAVGRSESPQTAAALIARLRTMTPAVRLAALRVLLSRADWTASLLEAAEQGTARLADLPLDQQQRLAAHPDEEIAAKAQKLLAQGGGLPDPDRQKVLDELMPLTKKTGDPVAGKEVFKKQCAKCHVHGGEGTRIGPDLTGMAVHPKHELLTQIIDPSRSVEGNFRVYTVITADGLVMSGLLASETRTSLELFDAEGKKHVLLREDVEEIAASPKSLMPEGFEKQASEQDLANLLEFLTQKGRFVPLPLEKAATIATTRGMFYSEDAGAERLVFRDWSPKEFAGVPFHLVDPNGGARLNAIMLHGPQGRFPPQMPRSASLPLNAPAAAIHLLSGVSGWGYPASPKGAVSMIVRLHYADGSTEDHPLVNGEHFADYIRRVDVPGSQFAFGLRGQQLRYLAIHPRREETIERVEFLKGEDRTAPVIMAATAELPQSGEGGASAP
ncbi:MAG: ThuA domain-containing protein [Planctomycetes bacterium]|nr:ThuA domain-containing protein [Planctomycetota bacterium]